MEVNLDAPLAPKNNLESDPGKADLKQYCGNWIWRALECLVDSKDFNPSPKWISQRLNISIENAVDAIEGLERMGLIVRTGNSFKSSQEVSHIGVKELTREDLLENQSRLAPQIISKLTEKSKFTTYFMLGNDELIAKYSPQFMKLYVQMQEEGKALGLTQVVASEISFAVLSDSNTNGGAQ